MVIKLNLTDFDKKEFLINLLKRLKYIEVRPIKNDESTTEAEEEHEALKSAFLAHSKRFLANHYEKL